MKKFMTLLDSKVSYILHWTLRVNPQKVWVNRNSLIEPQLYISWFDAAPWNILTARALRSLACGRLTDGLN